ncbi:MAG: hydrogenase maturation protease [Kosmotoga sp.]|nr:MAG: hydrogenase maturation protease [Kosmotoga sp.]
MPLNDLYFLNHETLFAGLGNPLRKDDASGLILLDKLSAELDVDRFSFIKCYQNPENYFDQLTKGYENIVFLDNSKNLKTDWKLMKAEEIDDFSFSTHTFGLSTIITFLRNQCDSNIFLIVIKVYNLSLGKGLNEKVKVTIDSIVGEIEKNVRI